MKKYNKGNGAVALILVVGGLILAVIVAVAILSYERQTKTPTTPTETPVEFPSTTIEQAPVTTTPTTPKVTSTPKPVVKPVVKPTTTGEIEKKPVEETPVVNYPPVTSNMIKVLDMTNQARAEAGLPPLSLNPQLSQAAQAKANYIAETGDFAHTSKDGKTGGDYMREAGYAYSDRGENLARGYATIEDTFNAWMASPTHKRNILWANFQEIGIGFNGNIVVQEFGLKYR